MTTVVIQTLHTCRASHRTESATEGSGPRSDHTLKNLVKFSKWAPLASFIGSGGGRRKKPGTHYWCMRELCRRIDRKIIHINFMTNCWLYGYIISSICRAGSEATNHGAGQLNLSQRIFVYMFVYLCMCNAQECKKYLIQCAGIHTHEANVILTISGHELLFISLDFMVQYDYGLALFPGLPRFLFFGLRSV